MALFDGQRVLSETTWLAGREHSTRVLVEVQDALLRVGLTPQDLTGLVVARGPGSFTGVRVALSVAKGISAGLAIPLWGVSSLDVLAHAAGQVDLPVRAVLEAGRGRFATGLYLNGRCSGEPRLATLEQLDELTQAPTFIIGELPEMRGLAWRRTFMRGWRRRRRACGGAAFWPSLAGAGPCPGDPGDPRTVDALYVS